MLDVPVLWYTMVQYFKDRTESFDDYYPCNNKQSCDLTPLHNWLKLLICIIQTIRNKSTISYE